MLEYTEVQRRREYKSKMDTLKNNYVSLNFLKSHKKSNIK